MEILKKYLPLLTSKKARGAYLAYFLFQLGNFSSFSFIGKWITEKFHFSLEQVGYFMIFIGAGSLVGSLWSGFIAQRYRLYNTMLISSLLIVFLFIILPYMTYACQLLDNGAPLDFIQGMLGHEKASTTQIYAQLRGERRKELYRRFF